MEVKCIKDFRCKNKDTEKCLTCKSNSKLKDNFSLKPTMVELENFFDGR